MMLRRSTFWDSTACDFHGVPPLDDDVDDWFIDIADEEGLADVTAGGRRSSSISNISSLAFGVDNNCGLSRISARAFCFPFFDLALDAAIVGDISGEPFERLCFQTRGARRQACGISCWTIQSPCFSSIMSTTIPLLVIGNREPWRA